MFTILKSPLYFVMKLSDAYDLLSASLNCMISGLLVKTKIFLVIIKDERKMVKPTVRGAVHLTNLNNIQGERRVGLNNWHLGTRRSICNVH